MDNIEILSNGYLATYAVTNTMINGSIPVKINRVYSALSSKSGKINVVLRADGESDILIEDCNLYKTHSMSYINIKACGKIWMEKHFPYTYAILKSGYKIEYNQKAIKSNQKAEKNKKKLPYPGETLLINGDTKNQKLVMEVGRAITAENATKFLDDDALSKVLSYMFNNIEKFDTMDTVVGNKNSLGRHIVLRKRSTEWMSAEEYSKKFSQKSGIYILRRESENGKEYYIGKALNIIGRVKAIESEGKWTVGHKNGEQYDDIRYDEIDINNLDAVYKAYYENNKINGKWTRKLLDSVLYAVEDIAIHTTKMIMSDEKSSLKNKAFSTTFNKVMNK